LELTIKSEGKLGFDEMRACVKFRRRWRLRTVSTPWVSVVIPDPEQDQAGQYSAYASQLFRPFGNWTVRNVGLELHAITVETVGLWARDPWHRRALEFLLRRISAVADWGQKRAQQEQHSTWEEIILWAEQHHPWWWRVRDLRRRLVAFFDRGDPDTRIYATAEIAWRVDQHGGEVVRLAQRYTYRLSFTRSGPMEGIMSAHQFSGASPDATADPRYRYRLRLPGDPAARHER
jgi:hypothetical protein